MRSLLSLSLLACLLWWPALGLPAQDSFPHVIHGPVRSPVNGHTYYLVSDSTWQEAEMAAFLLGGHLATVRNQFEQKWIFETFRRIDGVPRNLWIGLYDPDPDHNSNLPEVRKGEFAWVSGEPVTFSQWSATEPNNTLGVEFYAHLWEPGIGVEGYWNDLPATVPGIYVGRMGGVVEITKPSLLCSDLSVDCGDTLPTPENSPRIIGSCVPENEVELTFADAPHPIFFGSIQRTWTARDPCGESSCTQSIIVRTGIPPNPIERRFRLGGLVAEFILHVPGFTRAEWSIGGSPIENEPGAQILDSGRRLILDFSVFRGGTFTSFYDVNAQIVTACTGGGGTSGGTALPLIALARTGATFDSVPNGETTAPYANACASFGSESRWLRLVPNEAGQVAVSLPGAPETTRLTVLSGNALAPTEVACGTGVVSFRGQAGTEYIIGANASTATRFDCRMVQAPTLVATPPSLVLTQDTSSPPLAVTVADADSDVNRLILSARSSNPSLLDATSFAFGGEGAARTVLLTPIAGRSGETTVTLRVTDPTGAFHEASFPVSVRPSGPRVRFVRLDTETRGNWRSTYPGFRPTIVGATFRLPEIPRVVKGDVKWADPTRDTRAPETTNGAPDRVAAAWVATQQMSIRLNLPESQATRVALYFLDWDRATRPARQQRIILRDPTTRTGLSTNEVSEFGNGQYLVFDVRGPVDVEIINLSPGRVVDAAISAILLGEPSPSLASLVRIDRTTSGNWRGVYGSQGTTIVGVVPRFPGLRDVTGKKDLPWAQPTSDPRALENPDGQLPRKPWAWSAEQSMTLILDLPTGTPSRIAAYFVDWDRLARVQRVDVKPRGSQEVVLSQTLRDFENGVYLVWDFLGPVDLVITNLSTRPASSAVVSGVFLGGNAGTTPAPPAPNSSARLQALSTPTDRVLPHARSEGANLLGPTEGGLETSTDLQSWTPVAPGIDLPTMPLGTEPARFFRRRLQPLPPGPDWRDPNR